MPPYLSITRPRRVRVLRNIEWDEIEHYKEMRYLCPTEAVSIILNGALLCILFDFGLQSNVFDGAIQRNNFI